MFIFKGLASRTSNKFGLFLINVTMPVAPIEVVILIVAALLIW